MKPIDEILVLHHSHTDIGYTHPQPILWELQRRFIEQAIDLCEETEDWPEPSQLRWTCETTGPVMHWLEQASPGRIERFSRFVRERRIAFGAMFCNITPLSNAETLGRSLAPLRILRERFGAEARVAINHDVNGLPWPLVQLLLDAGVTNVLMGINPSFGGAPLPRPRGFHWEASDGRRLLAFNGETYQSFDRRLDLAKGTIEALDKGIRRYLTHLANQDYPYDFVYLSATVPGWGDNNPPNPNLLKIVRQWNDEGRSPMIRLVTPETLFERLGKQPDLPTWKGDWTDWWNFGAGSSTVETRINRGTREQLKTVELLQAGGPKVGQESAARLEEAYDQLNLFDEHTWGAYATICKPWLDEVVHQWCHKAHYAFQARSLSRILYRDEMERVAANHNGKEFGMEGILFVNSAPFPREAFVRVPQTWLDRFWVHAVQKVQRLDSEKDYLEHHQYRVVGPLILPANGYSMIRIEELNTPDFAAGMKVEGNQLESPSHLLVFDPVTGRITSLFDKRGNWEIVPTQSEHPFFGYVQETVDPNRHPVDGRWAGRSAFFDIENDGIFNDQATWIPNWPAVRKGPSRFLGHEVVESPDGVTLVLRWEAPGVQNLEQRIKLFAHREAIELSASFYKEDIRTPEATYFVLPCNLETWQAHFDTAGLPAELDREQIPGSCRDWVTVDSWVSLHDRERGVTVACPEAPLVQVGDFNFGKGQQKIDRKANPMLVLWPANNYWHTNFRTSQPGFIRVRYELTSHGPFHPVAAARAGLDAACPIEIHPVVHLAETQSRSVVEVSPGPILLMHTKRASDGRGVLLSFANPSQDEAAATVRFPGKTVSEASQINTLDEDTRTLPVQDSEVEFGMPGRSLRRIRIVFD